MKHRNQELEICVESLQACHAASIGGADRIELCAALNEGGVTPSRGYITAAIALSTIPIHVLIRPRAGNFVYTDEEFAVMCADAEDALALGAAGIVIGMLTADGKIDHARMREFMRRTQGASITFHRAFDQIGNPLDALEEVISLGCARVLTSGGAPTVMEGLPMLTQLANAAAGRIRIAAGGGVTIANAAEIARVDGLDLHASLRKKASGLKDGTTDPLWVNAGLDGSIDVEDVRQLRNQIRTPDTVRATLVAADYTA